MRVNVCREGYENDDGANYDMLPGNAVRDYARQHADGVRSLHLVVTPLDDEARALSGWIADEDDPQFQLFVVTPIVIWEARQVASFRSAQESAKVIP